MAPRANARAVGFRGLTATFPRSLRSVALLRRRQVDLAEQLDLVVKLDAVLLVRPHDDLPVAEVRMPVQETELGRAQPPGAFCGGHERTLEDLGEVAAVRARVHPDAAADRAGDGAGELERPEARVARAMEADCVRGAAAGTQDVAVDLHLRAL